MKRPQLEETSRMMVEIQQHLAKQRHPREGEQGTSLKESRDELLRRQKLREPELGKKEQTCGDFGHREL